MKLTQKRGVRQALASLGAVAALLGGTLVATQSAAAWSYSSTVYVKGTAGCSNSGGIQHIHAEGSLDGTKFVSDSDTSGTPRYQIKFTNVRSGRVPSGGGWAWITVNCTSMGGYHQSWVEMYRPDWGDTITKNF